MQKSVQYRIQKLRKGQEAKCEKMNALFADAFDDSEHYLGAKPDRNYLSKLLQKKHVIMLVALQEGGLIGALVGYQLEKFEQERSEIYIYDLAVAKAHRRRGIATRLIETLQKIALKRHAYMIFVQADYGDEPAIALYTKLGLREDVMHFDIKP